MQESCGSFPGARRSGKSGQRGVTEIHPPPFEDDFAQLAAVAVAEDDAMARLDLSPAGALGVSKNQPLPVHGVVAFLAMQLIASIRIQNERRAGAFDCLSGDIFLRAKVAARDVGLGGA